MTPVKITLSQLELFLFKSVDILRGKMDASEFKEFDGTCEAFSVDDLVDFESL